MHWTYFTSFSQLGRWFSAEMASISLGVRSALCISSYVFYSFTGQKVIFFYRFFILFLEKEFRCQSVTYLLMIVTSQQSKYFIFLIHCCRFHLFMLAVLLSLNIYSPCCIARLKYILSLLYCSPLTCTLLYWSWQIINS